MFYVVATPIGNLGDITLRALEVLKSVDVVVAEDTRVTKKLLTHFNIQVQTISYREQVHEAMTRKILKLLSEGKSLAFVTDAGTPGVSDPGTRLVHEIRANDFPIAPIPGSSAITTAISISGVNMANFVFLGFPPAKKGREKFFSEHFSDFNYPIVLYESPHRIDKTLANLNKNDKNIAKVQVFRELTKKFEEFFEGSIADVRAELLNNSKKSRGEFVLIVVPVSEEK